MKSAIRIFCLALPLLLAACSHNNSPVTPSSQYATEFNFGQLEYYGAYYSEEGLGSQVIALDLYSEGLTLNRQGYMEGSGTNLYFSDIFLPAADSLSFRTVVDPLNPSAGKTTPADYPNYPDSVFSAANTGEPFTFLPGTYYEGNFTGAYILLVDSGALTSYTLVPSGTLTLRTSGDTTYLSLKGKISSGKTYEATYSGILQKVNKTGQTKTKSNVSRSHL